MKISIRWRTRLGKANWGRSTCLFPCPLSAWPQASEELKPRSKSYKAKGLARNQPRSSFQPKFGIWKVDSWLVIDLTAEKPKSGPVDWETNEEAPVLASEPGFWGLGLSQSVEWSRKDAWFKVSVANGLLSPQAQPGELPLRNSQETGSWFCLLSEEKRQSRRWQTRLCTGEQTFK